MEGDLRGAVKTTLESVFSIEKLVSSSLKGKKNQRTNGPVNAHLRSAAYTNKHV